MVVTGRKSASFIEAFRRAPSIEVSSAFDAVKVIPTRAHPDAFDSLSAAFIRFTSGTTGAAKGVVLSHQSIRERIHAANEVLKIDNQDRVLWLLSMSYHFAVSIVSYLSHGAAIILPDNHFASATCDAANRHNATIMYASPAHYTWLTEAIGAQLPASLRLAISTTAGIRQDAAQKFLRKFGLPLTQALGIIEVGLPFINTEFAADRPEAVGRVLPSYQLKLERSELGPTFKEVWLRGPGFVDAYYEPWQSREQIMPEGWFRTGDVGEMDVDGCLFLRGRTKDVISVLGAKFFPQEVESVVI
jgi:long-chain acyl-CoA synthetase